MKGGNKYHPLQEFLQRCDRDQITLTFSEIEALIGEPLPESARSKRSWWSNRRKGGLQASSWMDADYTVQTLDLQVEKVTFSKPPSIYKVQRVEGSVQWNGELVRALRHHMGMTQAELAKELGVRQQTISEWEKGVYTPTRATSNYLTLVAEKAAFDYEEI
jgi:DNA-binding transcriptional regulator YiaG